MVQVRKTVQSKLPRIRKNYEEWKQLENKEIKMVIAQWYVGDFTGISTRIEAGWRYNQELQRLEWTQEAWDEDK